MCLFPEGNWHAHLRANQACLFLLFYDSAILPPATGNVISWCLTVYTEGSTDVAFSGPILVPIIRNQ